MPRSKRLDRLGAQLAEEADYTASTQEELARTAELSLARMERAVLIPLDRLQGMAHQPRQSLREDEALHDLARSIAAEGVLQPLVAAPNPDKPGTFILIAGHRRLAAAGLLARQEVELPLPGEDLDDETVRVRQQQARAAARERVAVLPATLRDVDPDTAFALALVENLQRDDLTRREVMDAVKRLKDHYGWSIREIERRTGRSRTDLSRLMRIAEDDEVAALVVDEVLSPTAAGPLVERQHYPVRAPVLAAIRAGRITTLADVEAALEAAHAATRTEPAVDPQQNAASDPHIPTTEEPTVVSHMGQLTITDDARAGLEPATPAEPTMVTPVIEGERLVPVSSHTRRIGARKTIDPERAEMLAREMVLLAREDVPPDTVSAIKLREAIDELAAFLERHQHTR